MTARRVLLARLDNVGDVLPTGPAVRAVAACAEVVYLTSPQGAEAARLLPGVAQVRTHRCEWIDAHPPPVQPATIDGLVRALHDVEPDEACIFTSSHQSPLPLALLLRLAGVGPITAISHDYAGSLLDRRLPGDPDVHEVERNLLVVGAAGYELPADDDGALRVSVDRARHGAGRYTVVHPGASVPARTLAPDRWRSIVAALVRQGRDVVVTGAAAERELVEQVAATDAATCLGRPLADLATVLAAADAVVVGNTGPAHLAAAVGTPVVVAFAPTVPAGRWRPWGVPSVVLGHQTIPCSGCRSRVCAVPDQPCLATVGPDEVLAALDAVAPTPVLR